MTESTPAQKKVVAAFDFDGTITYRDSLLPFLFFTHGNLTTLWKLFLLVPMFLGYLIGIVPRQRAKERILTSFYAQTDIKQMQQLGKEYANTALRRRVRPEALERIAWHLQQGHHCVIISASIDTYLKPWAKSVGVHEVLSSKLATDEEGRATGTLDGRNCWGPEKVRRLEESYGPSSDYTLYAYGDSRGDRELLGIADFPFYRTMEDSKRDKEKPFKPMYTEHEHVLSGWRFKALIFTIILSILGYFFFTLWAGWDQVLQALKNLGTLTILTSLCIACVSYLCRFTRWNYFLHVLGYQIPLLKNLQIYVAGFSLTTTPGKAGEALRSVFLNDFGIAYRRSFGALLAERLSDLLAVVILASGGFLMYSESRPIVFLSALFIVMILYTVQQDRWLVALERWANKLLRNRFAHIIEFILETVMAFRRCFSTHVLIFGAILGCLAWALEGSILYNVLKALGVELPIYTCIFIHAFALLVGALTLMPGGLGGAEVTMYQMLLFYDVPATIAVTATLFVRLSTLWFSVFLGLIALPKKNVKLGP